MNNLAPRSFDQTWNAQQFASIARSQMSGFAFSIWSMLAFNVPSHFLVVPLD